MSSLGGSVTTVTPRSLNRKQEWPNQVMSMLESPLSCRYRSRLYLKTGRNGNSRAARRRVENPLAAGADGEVAVGRVLEVSKLLAHLRRQHRTDGCRLLVGGRTSRKAKAGLDQAGHKRVLLHAASGSYDLSVAGRLAGVGIMECV